MEMFDPIKVFTGLGVALRNLTTYFPELEPQRLPFVPRNLHETNGALEAMGVSIVYKKNKFCVGDGLQRGTDPRIVVAAEFKGEVPIMDRVTALVEFARAMTALCEATITQDVPQDDYHRRIWEVEEQLGWGQTGCCFFDFPQTTLEEREQIAQKLGFDAVAFHFGKMFVFFQKVEESRFVHSNTLFVLNWSSNRRLGKLEPEQIFFWTRDGVDRDRVFRYLHGLKQPPCWFANDRVAYQPLPLGHRYIIG